MRRCCAIRKRAAISSGESIELAAHVRAISKIVSRRGDHDSLNPYFLIRNRHHGRVPVDPSEDWTCKRRKDESPRKKIPRVHFKKCDLAHIFHD